MEKVCTNFGVVFFLKIFIVFTFNLVHVSLHKKMKFSIKDFFSKCDQIRSFLRIWSHLLEKSLLENFIFCAVFINIKKETLAQAFSCEFCEIF